MFMSWCVVYLDLCMVDDGCWMMADDGMVATMVVAKNLNP